PLPLLARQDVPFRRLHERVDDQVRLPLLCEGIDLLGRALRTAVLRRPRQAPQGVDDFDVPAMRIQRTCERLEECRGCTELGREAPAGGGTVYARARPG